MPFDSAALLLAPVLALVFGLVLVYLSPGILLVLTTTSISWYILGLLLAQPSGVTRHALLENLRSSTAIGNIQASETCPFCYGEGPGEVRDPIRLPIWGHVFCRGCALTIFEAGVERLCPYCRQELCKEGSATLMARFMARFIICQAVASLAACLIAIPVDIVANWNEPNLYDPCLTFVTMVVCVTMVMRVWRRYGSARLYDIMSEGLMEADWHLRIWTCCTITSLSWLLWVAAVNFDQAWWKTMGCRTLVCV